MATNKCLYVLSIEKWIYWTFRYTKHPVFPRWSLLLSLNCTCSFEVIVFKLSYLSPPQTSNSKLSRSFFHFRFFSHKSFGMLVIGLFGYIFFQAIVKTFLNGRLRRVFSTANTWFTLALCNSEISSLLKFCENIMIIPGVLIFSLKLPFEFYRYHQRPNQPSFEVNFATCYRNCQDLPAC